MSTRLLLRPVIATMAVGLILVGVARLGANQLKPQVGQDSFVLLDLPTAEDIRQMRLQMEERNWAMKGGTFHKPLHEFFNIPGIEQPTLQKIEDIDLLDSTPVIGIVVEEDAYAFVVEKMHDPRAHIVNLILNEKAISVTYCNLQDCVRVVTNDSEMPIPLRLGGLDVDAQLVLLLDGRRYGQTSSGLPLSDHVFSRMNLGEWKQLHPSGMICVPPSRVSIEHRYPTLVRRRSG